MQNYFTSVGDSLSQFINNAIFLAGNANQSLSGRCYEQRSHWFYGRLRYVINFICFWELDHCYLAYTADIFRAQELVDRLCGDSKH